MTPSDELMRFPTELAAEQQQYQTRRWFFRDCGISMGSVALAAMAQSDRTFGDVSNVRQSHFPARAKRVIFLFQGGAPSHLELFDNKPELTRWNGKLPPTHLLDGYRAAFISPNSTLLGPRYQFQRHGDSGAELSELLPHTASVVDDLCIVKSVVTDAFNHAPAQIFMSTGSQQFGRPSMGAWVTYGLGTENKDLPGFVAFSTGKKGASGGADNYGCGFLPTVYAGVPFRGVGDPVLYLSNPDGIDDRFQQDTIEGIQALNRQRLSAVGDPEIAARINSYELAYRMQHVAPEATDLSAETQSTLDLYGAQPGHPSYASACLTARRLVERGVRFVQIHHEAWDHHGGLTKGLKQQCEATDQASAALIKDLKVRGMLEDTLVIWGGEFGRTPMVQGGNDGRDHHPNAFTMWLAGGGVKAGSVVGETDEFGFNVTADRVHVHDLHATILYLLGFDHERLSVNSQGLDFRLTGVGGEVLDFLIA